MFDCCVCACVVVVCTVFAPPPTLAAVISAMDYLYCRLLQSQELWRVYDYVRTAPCCSVGLHDYVRTAPCCSLGSLPWCSVII